MHLHVKKPFKPCDISLFSFLYSWAIAMKNDTF